MVEKNSNTRKTVDGPCMKERAISLKCLQENNGLNEKCQLAFRNFKSCLDFWDTVKKIRRQWNVQPYFPPSEEREQIQQHFKATGKLPNYSNK